MSLWVRSDSSGRWCWRTPMMHSRQFQTVLIYYFGIGAHVLFPVHLRSVCWNPPFFHNYQSLLEIILETPSRTSSKTSLGIRLDTIRIKPLMAFEMHLYTWLHHPPFDQSGHFVLYLSFLSWFEDNLKSEVLFLIRQYMNHSICSEPPGLQAVEAADWFWRSICWSIALTLLNVLWWGKSKRINHNFCSFISFMQSSHELYICESLECQNQLMGFWYTYRGKYQQR